MPFDNYSEDDFKAFAEEMNRPRTGLNMEILAERLRRATNAADVVGDAYRVLDEAQKNNSRGLVW